ncbi:MAG: hypothetical protein ACHBN1_22680 [Heteroscytonema crispum UTEX LB 1556]
MLYTRLTILIQQYFEKIYITNSIAAENITLEQLKDLFGLELVESDDFFTEWQDNLPELTIPEKELLNQIKAGYLNLRNYPLLLENTVNTVVVSPLLFIGKFYLPPFHIKLEKSVKVHVRLGL